MLKSSKNHQNVPLYGLDKNSSRLIRLVTLSDPLYDHQEGNPSNPELSLDSI